MSGDAQIVSAATTDRLLSAVNDQLTLVKKRYDLVVIGGSALLALGLISRATRDIDVLALASATGLDDATPLPEPLLEACGKVARDFSLPDDWINPGPADMLRFGLPDGFMDRLTTREYGQALTVRFASRFDQIHFKLYAVVDQGPGKHERDLRALSPTPAELLAAAHWSRTHDPSDGYLGQLVHALAYFGVQDESLSA